MSGMYDSAVIVNAGQILHCRQAKAMSWQRKTPRMWEVADTMLTRPVQANKLELARPLVR
jgi:hypothetical protein